MNDPVFVRTSDSEKQIDPINASGRSPPAKRTAFLSPQSELRIVSHFTDIPASPAA